MRPTGSVHGYWMQNEGTRIEEEETEPTAGDTRSPSDIRGHVKAQQRKAQPSATPLESPAITRPRSVQLVAFYLRLHDRFANPSRANGRRPDADPVIDRMVRPDPVGE